MNQSKNPFQQDLQLEGAQWKGRLPMTCVENWKSFATIKAGPTASWFLLSDLGLSVSAHHGSVQKGRHQDPIASHIVVSTHLLSRGVMESMLPGDSGCLISGPHSQESSVG